MSSFKSSRYTDECNEAVKDIIEVSSGNPDKLIALVVDHVTAKNAALSEKLAIIVSDVKENLPDDFVGCEVNISGSAAMGVLMVGETIEVAIKLSRELLHLEEKKGVPIFMICSKIVGDTKFTNVFTHASSTVTSVVFTHRPTQFICDLTIDYNHESSSCVKIFHILRLNVKIRLIVIFIMSWVRGLKMIGKDKFSSYAVVLLVIFYLQQMHKPMLPAIRMLRNENIQNPNNKDSLRKLVEGFFRFYSEISFGRKVFSPYAGVKLARTAFMEKTLVPYGLRDYEDMVRSGSKELKIDTAIVLQDPYNLCRNVTEAIDDRTLTDFRFSCNQALEMVMSKNLEQLLIQHIMPSENSNIVEKSHNLDAQENSQQYCASAQMLSQRHHVVDKLPSQKMKVMEELLLKRFMDELLPTVSKLFSEIGKEASQQNQLVEEVAPREQLSFIDDLHLQQQRAAIEVPSLQHRAVDEVPSLQHRAVDEVPTRHHRSVDEVPTRHQRAVDEVPTRHQRAVDEVPSPHYRALDEVPSRLHRAVGKVPSRHCDVDKIPSRRLRAINEVPSWHQRSTDEVPSRRQRSMDEVPSRRQRSMDEVPSRHRRSPDEAPSRHRHSPDEAPSRHRHSPDEAPSRHRHSPDEAPSRHRRSTDEAPSRHRRSPDEAPSRRHRSPDEAPSRHRRSPDEAPSWHHRSLEQVPSQRQHVMEEVASRSQHVVEEVLSREHRVVDRVPPLHPQRMDQILPLHHSAVEQVLPLHHSAVEQVLPLHHSAVEQVLPLHHSAVEQVLLQQHGFVEEVASQRDYFMDKLYLRQHEVEDARPSRQHGVFAERPSQYHLTDSHRSISQSLSPVNTSQRAEREANTSFKATKYLQPKYLIPDTDSGILVTREDLFQRWVNVMVVILPDFLINFVRLNVELVYDAGPQSSWESRENVAKRLRKDGPVKTGPSVMRKKWSCNGYPLLANWPDRKKASAEIDVGPTTHPMEREALVSQHLAATHLAEESVSFYFSVYVEENNERIRCYFENAHRNNAMFTKVVYNLVSLLPLWVQNAFEVGFSLRCVTGVYIPGNMHGV